LARKVQTLKSEVTKMKSRFFFLSSLIFFMGTAKADQPGLHQFVPPQSELVEVPLQRVYIPKVGFDDNDFIEAVTEGTLKNPCYTVAPPVVEVSGHAIRVRQMAWKFTAGGCGYSADVLDDPVHFTQNAPIGHLALGDYRVDYRDLFGATVSRAFGVEKAKSENVDNFDYATVRGIDMEERSAPGTEISVSLRGLFPEESSTFVTPMKVEVQDDVVIVFPVLQPDVALAGPDKDRPLEPVHPGILRRTFPFREQVKIGVLKPGNYLLHVRSRGGNAVYRPFVVAKP
jgi:hypothetical protein